MIKFFKISFLIILLTFFHGCEEKKDLKFKFNVSQNRNESKTDQEIQESQAEKDPNQLSTKVQNQNDESIDDLMVENERELAKEDSNEIQQGYIVQNSQIISESNNKNNDVGRYKTFMIIASILLLSITLVSILISFYLYRWRVVVSEKLQIMVPESFHSNMEGLMKATNFNTKNLDQNIGSFKKSIEMSTEKMDEMIESYLIMRKKIDEKDSEIKRLKEGYDITIFKSFLNRILRVNTDLIKIKNEASDKGNLSLDDIEYLVESFEEVLNECGVTQFVPSIGSDYRKIDGVSQNPKTQETHEKSKEYTISEVIEPGFKIDSNNGQADIIKPAKVKIFIPKK